MHPTGRAWNDLCRSMYLFPTDMTVIAVVLKVRQSRNSSLSTMSNMDRQLLCQKSRQKFSVMKKKHLPIPEK